MYCLGDRTLKQLERNGRKEGEGGRGLAGRCLSCWMDIGGAKSGRLRLREATFFGFGLGPVFFLSNRSLARPLARSLAC